MNFRVRAKHGEAAVSSLPTSHITNMRPLNACVEFTSGKFTLKCSDILGDETFVLSDVEASFVTQRSWLAGEVMEKKYPRC